jgi:branched-chain amino acid transport system ATP-binding protein
VNVLEAPKSGRALLELRNLRKSFGGVQAVNDVELAVESRSVHGLIGPNGAGKTTLFNLVTHQTRPEGGQVLFAGRDITGEAPDRIVARGLTRTFQSAQLFAGMTVLENVRMGMHWRTHSGILDAVLPGLRARREERLVTERALAALELVGLESVRNTPAGSLPYGLQRLVEIARALVGAPRLLLLDEPAAGMDARESDLLVQLIARINIGGVTILIIDHDMDVVLTACSAVTVLDHGKVIASGTPDEIRQDQGVLEAYLGAWAADAGA